MSNNDVHVEAKTRSVDAVLKQTEVGSFFLSHKAKIFVGVLFLFLYVVLHASYVFWHSSVVTKKTELLFNYEQSLLKPFE